MKKIILFVLFVLTTTIIIADDWEGTYAARGSGTGIVITRVEDAGGYVIQRVLIRDNEVTQKIETQRDFVPFFEGRELHFSWMTGRQFPDDPDSNELIVYRIRKTGLVYSGVYFFPELSLREAPAQFTKLE